MDEREKMELPESAFRELKEGEEYQPVMPADKVFPEVNVWTVTWGIIMAVIFSAAAAYLGLKVGQVFEAAIPIAIIAVGVSAAAKRKKALGENVIIQSIGACSGAVVAGAIFTLPAIYILQAKYQFDDVSFYKMFLASLLGGILGILFLIPFRKYFVKDMHGKYPFPEATATTQVLMSGEKGGGQAKPLLVAGLVGGLYDFVVSTFGLWNEVFTSRMVAGGEWLAAKAKMVFSLNTGAAVLGLGYIIGLRYTLIICIGSLAVWWLLVPGMALLFSDSVLNMWDPTITTAVGDMSPEQIFKAYGKSIGIGAIAMSGIIGIIKSWDIIKGSISRLSQSTQSTQNNQNIQSNQNNQNTQTTPRTDQDLSFKFIGIGAVTAIICTFLFFWLGVMEGNMVFALVAILLTVLIAFLFTTVAANAIAIVGSNPVSGMTLMTLILASVVMVAVGLKGVNGMIAALIMGGVVCTALSVAGSFITDLKIGYWLGTTPKKQETWKFLGTLVSAATVVGVMIVLNQAYGFASGKLAAPQANAMAAVIDPLMNGVGAPWLLYGIGAVLAVVLTLCKVPALPFALGMFIPLELNTPLVVGGLINWFVTTRSKDEAVNKERGEKGNLIASGFIAGGALMGVVSAMLRFANVRFDFESWWQNPLSEWLSLAAYLFLICYFIMATRTKDEKSVA